MALRFLQIGDTHLGASLSGLPPNVAEGVREALRQVLREAFAAAAQLPVDIVLMPGDLFEQDGLDPAGQLRYVYELAQSIAPVPVVIAPGNHDAIAPHSPYLSEPAPGNVAVFKDAAFSIVDTRAGRIVGRAAQAGEGTSAVDWSKLPLPPPAPGILLLHASVLHAEDGRRHEQMIAPVSTKVLGQIGYSYVALGHYHSYKPFYLHSGGQNSGELASAAYAGCPQGQGWDEPGPKGYLTGELLAGGARLEFIPAAPHVIHRRRLNLPPEYANDALQQLEQSLHALCLELGTGDMLDLSLRGRWPLVWRPELEQYVSKALREVWHAKPVEFSRVDFTPALVSPGDSPVLDEFLSRCDEAISSGSGDEEAWRLARYLGHRLLSGQGLPGEVA